MGVLLRQKAPLYQFIAPYPITPTSCPAPVDPRVRLRASEISILVYAQEALGLSK